MTHELVYWQTVAGVLGIYMCIDLVTQKPVTSQHTIIRLICGFGIPLLFLLAT